MNPEVSQNLKVCVPRLLSVFLPFWFLLSAPHVYSASFPPVLFQMEMVNQTFDLMYNLIVFRLDMTLAVDRAAVSLGHCQAQPLCPCFSLTCSSAVGKKRIQERKEGGRKKEH